MCKECSNGLKIFLAACGLVFWLLPSASLSAQEATQSTSDTKYVLSEPEKQQLLQILQTLSDRSKAAQAALQASEQALVELKAQSAITEANYKASLDKLKVLQQAWDSLQAELTGLQQDKATLSENLQALQATLQALQGKYQELQTELIQLQADYMTLQANYKAQTDSFNQLNQSFKDYRKSAEAAQTKSLILEVIAFLLAAGWGIDALGVF